MSPFGEQAQNYHVPENASTTARYCGPHQPSRMHRAAPSKGSKLNPNWHFWLHGFEETTGTGFLRFLLQP